MMITTVEKFAETIGYEIGTSDDLTQANLLNGFCKALSNSIVNRHDLDMQLCYISERLDKKSEEIIKRLNEFVILKQKENV